MDASDHFVAFVDRLAADLDATPARAAAMAAQEHLSRFHFERVIGALAGESPTRFRARLLMERAAYRMVTTDATLLDIAVDAGFSSHEAFTRAFRREYDAAPSAWRASPARFQIAAPSDCCSSRSPATRASPPWPRRCRAGVAGPGDPGRAGHRRRDLRGRRGRAAARPGHGPPRDDHADLRRDVRLRGRVGRAGGRVGAAAASLGALLALLAGVGRTTLAMARERDLPTWLASIHPTHRVPDHAQVSIGAAVVVLVLFFDLRGAIGFSSCGVLVYYAVANAAAFGQPASQRRWPRALNVAGLLGCIVLVATLPAVSVVAGITVLVVGVVGRWLVRWRGAPDS